MVGSLSISLSRTPALIAVKNRDDANRFGSVPLSHSGSRCKPALFVAVLVLERQASDEPRPGRPRTLADERVAEVIEWTLTTGPADATRWSLRSMAKEAGLPHMTIWRVWGAFGLQPHHSETFRLFEDLRVLDQVLAGDLPWPRPPSATAAPASAGNTPDSNRSR